MRGGLYTCLRGESMSYDALVICAIVGIKVEAALYRPMIFVLRVSLAGSAGLDAITAERRRAWEVSDY